MGTEKTLKDTFGETPYRLLFEEIRDFAILHLDREGHIISWNAGAAAIFGYEETEAIGKPFAFLFTQEDVESGVPEWELKKAAETGRAEDVRWHECKDGTRFYANGVTTALRDENGDLRGFAKVARDDTARRQAELDLQASEVRYRRLFEAAYDGILILNAETGQITDVNPYLCKLLEYPHAEFIEKKLWEIGLFEDKDESQAAFRELQEKGYIRYEDKPLKTKSGENREVEVVSNVYREDGHHVIQCNIRDITERKRVEVALRESEARYRLVTDTASDAILTIDEQSTILFANPATEKIFGHNARELIGQSLTVLMPDYLRKLHHAGLGRYVETGHKHISWEGVELKGVHLDGHEIPIEVSFGEFKESGRRFFTGAVRDISVRKRAEEERERLLERERQAREEAEQANRLKDEFLATLSHELRTPLTSIVGWSAMLANSQLDPTNARHAIEVIQRNARMQVQMIDDLLDVSRIITGKLRMSVQPVDLGTVIIAAVDGLRPASEAKEIRLQLQLDSPAGKVFGDPDRLQQVAWNLISNAIKFTPRGGRVLVRLERVNSHVEITVSDTGEGIAPEFLPHVFDRFRQADATYTRAHGGLGLGLAIVRQLVELHGGTVRVDSAGEGHGSTFTVSLPSLAASVAADHMERRVHPQTTNSSEFECPPQLAGVRVLVVDDEADTRELMRFILEGCGARVSTADSAAAALEALRAEAFDVLISDIGMPEEDGYALIAQVRALDKERGSRIPAAALTAYASEEDRIRTLRSGFQIHVPKPVSPGELIAVVVNLAERTGTIVP